MLGYTWLLFVIYLYGVSLTFLVIISSNVIVVVAVTINNGEEEELKQKQNYQKQSKRQQRQRPNFVIILTDDLDYSLGGINASTLNKTRYYIGGGDHDDNTKKGNNNNNNNNGDGGYGKTINNWFVQTPVCCSSRAELFTGKMYHNLKVKQLNNESQTTTTTTTQEQQQAAQEQQQQQQHQQHQCMHIDVDGNNSKHIFWDQYYFAQYFASLNYNVGIFGKHLNTQNPNNFIPKGINEMLINGGGDYINPSFIHGIRTNTSDDNDSTNTNTNNNNNDNDNDNTKIEEITFDNCKVSTGYECYSTSIIGNASLAWIRKQVNNYVNDEDKKEDVDVDVDVDDDVDDAATTDDTINSKPFFALISVKAPHIQDEANGFPITIPAPWYKDVKIKESKAPRTPNYNKTGSTFENPKHWLIHQQTPITLLEEKKIDELYISRLKSLLSVDDLIEDLITTLNNLNVLNITYIIFTSDNGYRLGQYNIPQCKLHPYENDIRVPFLIRGPGILNQAEVDDDDDADDDANDDDDDAEADAEAEVESAETETGTRMTTMTTTTTTTTTAAAIVSPSDDATATMAATATATISPPPLPLGAIFSHIHLMPTLLGLATQNYYSQDHTVIPKTMDGTNLASYILDYNPNDNTNEKTATRDAFIDDLVVEPTTTTSINNYTTSIDDNDNYYDNDNTINDAEDCCVSLLIEYTSLGNVIRYQHLIDTYNHSFIALRIMPKYIALQKQLQLQSHYYLNTKNQTKKIATAISRGRQRSYRHNRHSRRILYNNTTTMTTSKRNRLNDHQLNSNNIKRSRSTLVPTTIVPPTTTFTKLSNNIKYIEFRDSRIDYTNTKTKPLEYELYDLDKDPYELNNIYYNNDNNNDNDNDNDISLEFKNKLEQKIKRLLHCNGERCRYEHSTGL